MEYKPNIFVHSIRYALFHHEVSKNWNNDILVRDFPISDAFAEIQNCWKSLSRKRRSSQPYFL